MARKPDKIPSPMTQVAEKPAPSSDRLIQLAKRNHRLVATRGQLFFMTAGLPRSPKVGEQLPPEPKPAKR